MIIGLTGKYCAGKTSAAKILEKKDFFIINVDKVGHQVLADKKGDIVKQFGKTILANDNSINRNQLAAIVFQSRKKLELLNNLLHPAMVSEVKKIINENKYQKMIVIDAALLFQMGLDKLCQKIFIIKTNFFISLIRSIKREGLNLYRFLRILHSQVYTQNIKTRLKQSDSIVIWNNQSVSKLEKKVNKHLSKIDQ